MPEEKSKVDQQPTSPPTSDLETLLQIDLLLGRSKAFHRRLHKALDEMAIINDKVNGSIKH